MRLNLKIKKKKKKQIAFGIEKFRCSILKQTQKKKIKNKTGIILLKDKFFKKSRYIISMMIYERF